MKIGLPVVLLVSLMAMISGESRGMNVDGVVDELSRKVADSQVRPNYAAILVKAKLFASTA